MAADLRKLPILKSSAVGAPMGIRCVAVYESYQLKQFTDLGLAEPILRAIKTEGYTAPTPIQAQAIPIMMSGKDMVGIAQTGTGKTAAFVLPLLHRISELRDRPIANHCVALILAPTRELASQIADSIRTYGSAMRVSVAIVVGGVKPGGQIRMMARGVDVVVATPGRLLDHVQTGVIKLDRTETVVLDEGDQMLDLGFMPTIRKIMAKLPKKRQTVLFSATMPQQIRSLADDFLNQPSEIAVTPTSKPIELINQKVMHVDRDQKRDALVGILRGHGVGQTIVFTRTKRGADKVNEFLQKAGLSSGAIHGNKSQPQRQRTLDDFRSSKVKILVATDIAARGIDVDGVSHVINYELPNVPEAYVHRIGRTARAGKSGIAISLCEHSERGLLRDIERTIGTVLERDTPPGFSGQGDRQPRTAERSVSARPNNGAADRPYKKFDKPKARPQQQQAKSRKPHRGQASGRSQSPNSGLQRLAS